jgi:hypothetical protein
MFIQLLCTAVLLAFIGVLLSVSVALPVIAITKSGALIRERTMPIERPSLVGG